MDYGTTKSQTNGFRIEGALGVWALVSRYEYYDPNDEEDNYEDRLSVIVFMDEIGSYDTDIDIPFPYEPDVVMKLVNEALYRAVANSINLNWGNPDNKDKCDRLYQTFLGYFSNFDIEDYVREMFHIPDDYYIKKDYEEFIKNEQQKN